MTGSLARVAGRRLGMLAVAVPITMTAVGCASTVAGTAVAGPSTAIATLQGPLETTETTETTVSPTRTSSTARTARTAERPTSSTATATATGPATPTLKSSTPTSATGNGADIITVDSKGVITLTVGKPKASVDIYEEPLCPPCSSFHAQFDGKLYVAVATGKLAVRLRVVTFLDSRSASNSYSTRAFAALLAVAADQQSPSSFLNFHGLVFANQPKEDAATDLTDRQLSALAQRAGVRKAVVDEIARGTWHSRASGFAAANLRSLQQTPGTVVAPKVVQGDTTLAITNDWIDKAVQG